MSAKNMLGGFLAGAALGVAAGLLFAPASGIKTRKKILKGSLKMKRNVVDYVDESIEALRGQINDKIDQVAKKSKDTVNHVSDKVKV